ncbi:diacylglycerol/lipid kinase family protein [Chondromyces apiculatus]|uniref:DAGKc domain-containing protein n=1 Tax=Chondromyces apiculatus DSM 436 TaxID=1192034 RepID=A0A017T166_9BACT|nr:diacylglycerol kinase family protein [Chondromyces apiculatus]EYF02968.1 Hypothetical protein CAP_6391 [Chondromyces apiculatus DSM 436]
MPRPLAIVLNTAARDQSAAGLKLRLSEQLHAVGLDADLVCVEPGDDVDAAARRAVDAGYPVLVAAGGDGTISSVAGAVVGTGVTLGVLPFGTINHFAKSVGIPWKLEDAVKALATGHTVQVDAGEVNGRLFVNNSTFGIHPSIIRYRDELRATRGMNKWVAYAMATAALVPNHALTAVRMITASGERWLRTPFVFVGNNDYLLGDLDLGGRPAPGHGELGVSVVTTEDRLAMVRLLGAAAMRQLHLARDIEHARTPEMVAEIEADRILIALDGEVREFSTPLHYRALPGALRVITPPTVGARATPMRPTPTREPLVMVGG